LFGTELDVSAGQFQVSDPLFKRELRLTLEDYQIYRARPGLSGINLTYDRGIMLGYGLPTKTDFVAEILNGNDIGSADATRDFDNDKYKTGFLRVSQELGKAVRLGGFGYYGKEEYNNNFEMTCIALKRFEFLQRFAYFRRCFAKIRYFFSPQKIHEFIISHVQQLGGLAEADFFVEIKAKHETLIAKVRRGVEVFNELIRHGKTNFLCPHGFNSNYSRIKNRERVFSKKFKSPIGDRYVCSLLKIRRKSEEGKQKSLINFPPTSFWSRATSAWIDRPAAFPIRRKPDWAE
jgi:hypothetical protein